MTTIFYNRYHASKGTTSISKFWGDVHVLDFRADIIIDTFEDLKEVVERFNNDNNAFDRIDYSGHAKTIKANRSYTVVVERRVDFEVIVFKYKDKEYKLKSKKLSTLMKARKHADEILEEYLLQTICLVDDETDTVIGEKEVIGKVDLYI